MSNVDNEGLRTLDQIRARRASAPIDTTARLNPGELEEVEAAARRGTWADPLKVLALVNTITALSRRIAVRFNETAQARQDAVAARERAERAEQEVTELDRACNSAAREVERLIRQLEARGPMADLGKLADAVAGAERAEQRNQRLVDEMARHNRVKDSRIAELEGLLALATQEHETARNGLEQARTSLKDARVQIADLRAERGALYTKYQVAELQTSEAELVSAPLKRRIEELEAQGNRAVDALNEAQSRKDAAEHRAARAARRIGELEQSVAARDGILERVREETSTIADRLEDELRTARTRLDLAQVALNDWEQHGETVAGLVFTDEVTGALEYEGYPPDMERAWTLLAGVVRGVRAAMPAYQDGREGRTGA